MCSSAAPCVLAGVGGQAGSVRVSLAREAGAEGMQEGAGLGSVIAPLYPVAKAESWWLVLGIPGSNSIAAIRRVALAATASATLDFTLPAGVLGPVKYKLYLMSDS